MVLRLCTLCFFFVFFLLCPRSYDLHLHYCYYGKQIIFVVVVVVAGIGWGGGQPRLMQSECIHLANVYFVI